VILRRARLWNVRCHEALEIEFGGGLTLVVGGNGAGKSSVLEAIHFALRGTSPRTTSPRELIRRGQQFLRVEVDLATGASDPSQSSTATAAAAIDAMGERRVTADGTPLADFGRWEESVPLRSFFPDDLRLVKGSPARRRRYMDDMEANRRPEYRQSLRGYQDALDQRNALLRQGLLGADQGPWEAILAREGLNVARLRALSLALFAPLFSGTFERLARPGHGAVVLTYRTNVSELDEDSYRLRLAEMRESDRRRGFTHVGPHRDDLRISVGGLDLRESGSQGEQRAALLALLMAERESVTAGGGAAPLLLLDDVMSELDAERRRALVSMLLEVGQSVVTATDTHHFAEAELSRMNVVAL
jgi:DNA replication and repair protein RecF